MNEKINFSLPLSLKVSNAKKKSLFFCILKTDSCFSGGGKEDNTAKDKPNVLKKNCKRKKRGGGVVGRQNKQLFRRFKGVSRNLSSIKLLINTRVAAQVAVNTASPSQDKRRSFSLSLPLHWTPAFRSMGWPWPVGASLRSAYQHSAGAFSGSEPAGKAADKPSPSFEWLIMLKWCPEITPVSWGKKRKKKNVKRAVLLPANMYLTSAQSITAAWDFKSPLPCSITNLELQELLH